MSYPIIREQRRYFAGGLLSAALWTAGTWALCLGAIEYFYGPGEAFSKAHPILMGGLTAVLMVAFFVTTGWFLARLAALLLFPARLKRSAARYLRPDQAGEALEVLSGGIRQRLYGVLDIWMGEEWLVFPGKAMKRDAIVGIYREDLSRRYLSKKTRYTVVDQEGEEMAVEGAGEFFVDFAYGYLLNSHATISWGDRRELTAFRLREQQQGEVDYRKLRRPPEDQPTALGVCKWDQSPILEDNLVRSQYEKWLLAAYAPYIAGGTHIDGDFRYAGGYPFTKRQQRLAINILKDPWDIHGTGTLIQTLNHLLSTGRAGRDGWQLGRAMMVLGYGYIAGYIPRWQLLDYSCSVAKAIQGSFSSWKELHDSYMFSYLRWSRDRECKKVRTRAYRQLLDDPGSILNTVPFGLDIDAAFQEALAAVGGYPEVEDDFEVEDEFGGSEEEE